MKRVLKPGGLLVFSVPILRILSNWLAAETLAGLYRDDRGDSSAALVRVLLIQPRPAGVIWRQFYGPQNSESVSQELLHGKNAPCLPNSVPYSRTFLFNWKGDRDHMIHIRAEK
jgi:hypothetical protein